MRAITRAWMDWVRTLYPGYFACVMATGIVSVALLLAHVTALSVALWILAGALLAYLALAYLVRAARYPRELRRDALDPATAFGYFTFIAAAGVTATRCALGGWTLVPALLTAVAGVAWFGLIYWTFAMLLFTNEQPIERALNGSWLIAIVATESLAITWVLLIPILPAASAPLQLLAYAFWTLGVLLYIIVITLIMYRFFFTRLRHGDLTPPYWINMGAMAITTVAGVRMLDVARPTALLVALRPFIAGLTVMMWAWGTWWIPLLLVIGCWKYLVVREPIRYQPTLWSVVFPLGMYATALQLLTHIPGLAFLAGVGMVSAWLALAAWALVMAGWLWSAVRAVRGALRGPAAPRAAMPPPARVDAPTDGQAAPTP
ncbi:MAG TPA: tellurite resistance/C4-dicarboxylate transporter family protein [Ktedonobacterales bacterium]